MIHSPIQFRKSDDDAATDSHDDDDDRNNDLTVLFLSLAEKKNQMWLPVIHVHP